MRGKRDGKRDIDGTHRNGLLNKILCRQVNNPRLDDKERKYDIGRYVKVNGE
jgi:hypothetical protein